MLRERTIEDEINDFNMAYQSERGRIAFVEARDGKEAACEFAKQGIFIYGNSLNGDKPCMARTREHRNKFIASILFYEEYLGLIEMRTI